MKRKFKLFITLILSVILTSSLLCVSSMALSSDITNLIASYSNKKVSITGQTSGNIQAVALMICKGDTILRLETVGVTQNNFTAVITIALSSGTYTVKAADYEGGEFYTANFSIASSNTSSSSSSSSTTYISPTPTATPQSEATPQITTQTSTDSSGNSITKTTTTLTDSFGNSVSKNVVTVVDSDTGNTDFSVIIESDGYSAPLTSDILESALVANTSSATIATKEGTVILDNETLKGIKEDSYDEDLNVFIEKKTTDNLPEKIKNRTKNSVVYELKITSGKKQISDFAGTATISIAVPEEYKEKIVQLQYITDDGNISPVEGYIVLKNKVRYYEFKTKHFSFYAIEAIDTLPFNDVIKTEYWYESIHYAYANGLFSGTSQTSFTPNGDMTRGMLVTVLYRLEGLPKVNNNNKFTDVEENSWYKDAIIWASSNGIISGYTNEVFAPEDPVLREQIAVILYNYAKYKGYSVKSNTMLEKYSDASDIDTWALTAMKWVNSEGIIVGTTSTTLSPLETASRGQVATMLLRLKDIE